MLVVCLSKGRTYHVDMNSLEWIKPFPEGFEWIAAYQAWLKAN